MLKTLRMGLTLTFASLLFAGCSKEEAMTSSQVEYQDVNISFFDASIEQMGMPKTRGDGTSLSNFFKRLDVALIPKTKTTEEIYKTSQISTEENFGKVSMRVPTGDYTLVGVANGRDSQANIASAESVTFANNLIGDVGYVVQPITVVTSSSTATACSLKRAVALFRIKCLDELPENAKSVIFHAETPAGFSFNPTTGLSISTKSNIDFTYSVNKTTDEVRTNREFDLYIFLSDETQKMTITVTTKDANQTVLNAMTFEDVTLQRNHVTTYTGQLFTAGSSMDFTFSDGEITAGNYDKEF